MAKKFNDMQADELVGLFVNTITNIITAETAKQTAQQSENNLINNMQYFAGADSYTSTQDLVNVNVNQLAKDSLNTHLEKVQSQQIEQFVNGQISTLQNEANKKYKGKTVLVSKVQGFSNQFEAVYLDSNSNQPRISEYKSKTIKGTIEEIALDQNILLIKPGFISRKLTPNRIFYRIHVLDMQTLEPQVKII